MGKTMRVGIVGCGVIADAYARHINESSLLTLHGVTDLKPERAEGLATKAGCRVYSTLDEMLADDTIELVVNLTIHHAHYAVTCQCLEAGRHVYSEKPLTMKYEEAQALVDLAKARGVRLACAPITFLGEAQQTAWRTIREGRLGQIRVAYAEVNWGRIETWHPEPEPFYDVGPLFDVGVYPLTVLTAIFGSARQVSSFGKVLMPNRLRKDGTPYAVASPDFLVTVVEFEAGPLARLTTNFYVNQKTQKASIDFHGDQGSLHLGHWFNFDAPLAFAPFNEPYEENIPHVREAPGSIQWHRGVEDMAEAIREGRPQRVTGEQAAHVVEIMCAAIESIQSHRPVEIASRFNQPEPMPWAMI